MQQRVELEEDACFKASVSTVALCNVRNEEGLKVGERRLLLCCVCVRACVRVCVCMHVCFQHYKTLAQTGVIIKPAESVYVPM